MKNPISGNHSPTSGKLFEHLYHHAQRFRDNITESRDGPPSPLIPSRNPGHPSRLPSDSPGNRSGVPESLSSQQSHGLATALGLASPWGMMAACLGAL